MSNLDTAIRNCRRVETTITLLQNGLPLTNQAIEVEQTKHHFLFGSTCGQLTAGFANGELAGVEREQAEAYLAQFLKLFNLVTLPFYWSRFEPEQGSPQTGRMLNTARWFREHGCTIKGHPLCWHTLAPAWLLALETKDMFKALEARVRRDVADFAGIVALWDVINEAVIMPVFAKYDNAITRLCGLMGRIPLIRELFGVAHEVNPGAMLLINDFDVSPAYDILVEGCLEAGIRIDAIGIQSHMHQGYWGSERTLRILERFTRFRLPIHFTESTLVSGHLMPPEIEDLNDYKVNAWPGTPEGEARQAEEVVLHYKTLLSQPLVQAVTWWGLTDGGWLNAPSGLLHQDHTPKPAYNALEKLIAGEWWLAPVTMRTDDRGQVTVAGFAGEYRVTYGGRTAAFTLSAETGKAAAAINL